MIATFRKTLTFLALAAMSAGGAYALAPDFMERLESEDRPAEDRARDGARRPYQVMRLLGVETGMTVVDVGAGGGWYTRVLAAAVGADGTVISQGVATGRGGPPPQDIQAMDNVEIVGDLADIDPGSADVAVTGLNVHHANEERGVRYFEQIAGILKPGGMLAVTDHIGDPALDNSSLHRISPNEVKGWIRQAGLELVEESDILRNHADNHTLSAQDPKLGRNTDRFLFIIVKPETSGM